MLPRRLFLIASIFFLYTWTAAASLTQSVKGRVIDQSTRAPLIGANVLLQGTAMGAATDLQGYFRISRVPLGRQTLKVTYIGYRAKVIPEILVGSAKEVDLIIEMEESVVEGETVVVTPIIEKSTPLNAMATVSARSFSVEETQRYAGGFDDPARLASSFAGVTYGNAQDNAIIIRGNAPKGLLWRLEGIDIPNPNHFPDGNVLGGGLFTIFSNQLLANSDFFTGAFPAEYGNALSGVFDMKLRNGNSDTREWTFQAGAMGIDVATEGPIGTNSGASYLVNYRYSTIGLLTDLNLIDADQELSYQDLSFKVNVPTRKAGTFSLWGIGSLDAPKETEEPDPVNWEHEWDRLRYDSKTKVGALGLNHRFVLGNSAFLNSTVAATVKAMRYNLKRLDDNLALRQNEFIDSFNGKLILKSELSHRLSPRLFTKTGVVYNHLAYDMTLKSTVDDVPETYQTFVDEEGSSSLFQAYTQMQMDIGPACKLNAGLHYQKFLLNGHTALEPRAGLSWSLSPRHVLNLGYGRHSQMEDIRYYLAHRETESGTVQPNRDLNFTHADHLVLGYDFQLTDQHRLKIEPYFQRLSNVPVRANGSFSFINLKDERYFNDPLVNEGTGTNIGIDLTLEKFLSNGLYYLITTSIFDSKYKGGDGIERDSRYNRHYVVNALLGKEMHLGDSNILGINLKFTAMGGEHISPVLRDASLAAKRIVYDESRAFEQTLSSHNALDISLTYRINRPGLSHVLALQVKNILGSANDYGYTFDYHKQDLVKDKMVIVLPSISYKVEF